MINENFSICLLSDKYSIGFNAFFSTNNVIQNVTLIETTLDQTSNNTPQNKTKQENNNWLWIILALVVVTTSHIPLCVWCIYRRREGMVLYRYHERVLLASSYEDHC